jgi:hypothetical protein
LKISSAPGVRSISIDCRCAGRVREAVDAAGRDMERVAGCGLEPGAPSKSRTVPLMSTNISV